MKFNIINIGIVDSTNNYAQNLISSKELIEGDVIISDHQENGRGQGANQWESERGKNLTFSIILKPSFVSPSDQFVLTEIVSLSVRDILIEKLGSSYKDSVKVKWPNDIYIYDKKIAGILFQNYIIGNEIDYSIVGIGLNLNQQVFISDAKNPVSLIHHAKKEENVVEFLEGLLEKINLRYEDLRYEADLFGIKSEYFKNMYRVGQWSMYSDKGGIFTGKIVDVDEYGRLEIITESNTSKFFMFKEVEFL